MRAALKSIALNRSVRPCLCRSARGARPYRAPLERARPGQDCAGGSTCHFGTATCQRSTLGTPGRDEDRFGPEARAREQDAQDDLALGDEAPFVADKVALADV